LKSQPEQPGAAPADADEAETHPLVRSAGFGVQNTRPHGGSDRSSGARLEEIPSAYRHVDFLASSVSDSYQRIRQRPSPDLAT
jgi:hypothetical protein